MEDLSYRNFFSLVMDVLEEVLTNYYYYFLSNKYEMSIAASLLCSLPFPPLVCSIEKANEKTRTYN